MPDHPRSCGANSVDDAVGHFMSGSSPLVRGQHYINSTTINGLRIIPARAGPTSWNDHRPAGWTDHPRSCGANSSNSPICVFIFGSSPLVRGQHVRNVEMAIKVRIIPARAGPTALAQFRAGQRSDHPRSCGANAMFPHFYYTRFGSSPLVRGQLLQFAYMRFHIWIIPARAGPTERYASMIRWFADHPRSCGANLHHPPREPVVLGSSPLVRGQLPLATGELWALRIIPARAGPT